MSLNDIPQVRETFSSFEIVQVDCTYSVAGCKDRAFKRVIVTSGGLVAPMSPSARYGPDQLVANWMLKVIGDRVLEPDQNRILKPTQVNKVHFAPSTYAPIRMPLSEC